MVGVLIRQAESESERERGSSGSDTSLAAFSLGKKPKSEHLIVVVVRSPVVRRTKYNSDRFEHASE